MSARSHDSGTPERRLLQLESHLRVQYVLTVVCVAVLAVTGLPQKFEDLSLSRSMIDLAGGIEMLRLVHRVAGGLLVLTGAYHVVLVLVAVLVLREAAPLRMIPSARDVRDALRATASFLRMRSELADVRERQYMHKVDYWFMAWGLGVMIGTGLVNLSPLRVAALLSADAALAALRTHSDAAPFMIAWAAFVHVPYSERTSRLFRGQAAHADAPEPITGSQEARARAPTASPDHATSVSASAAQRFGEHDASGREALS